MMLAMSRPWKHPKTGVYWLRKRVPDDLRAAVGKREEKRNPASRIVLDVKRRPGEGKRSYSDEEADRILSAARLETNPVLRWVPWLCAYSGARVTDKKSGRRRMSAMCHQRL